MDFNTDKRKLYLDVYKFKKWAKENYPECDENHDNGEWEFDYKYLIEKAEEIKYKLKSKDFMEEEYIENKS